MPLRITVIVEAEARREGGSVLGSDLGLCVVNSVSVDVTDRLACSR
ncbi:MAG: hypothetical protein ACRDRR_08935 [Pseudonocardiaceae bacterium]